MILIAELYFIVDYWCSIGQDVLTDLKADAETLPLDPVKEDWVGHKVVWNKYSYIKG